MRIATRDDLPALRALFAEANDAPYDLAKVAEEKCFGRGIAGEPVTRVVERDGRIVGAATTCGKWLRVLAVARDARRQGIGRSLLGDAQVIAAEPGNYFTPGVVDSDGGFMTFLRKCGYVEGAVTHNLIVALQPLTRRFASALSRERERGAPQEPGEGLLARATHHDRERVLAFIEREFGRIWRFEVSSAFERETPPLFITEERGAITGFAGHDLNNRGLGFFGPTGVAKQLRGRGLGRKLLLASLEDLRELGYDRAVIPWTDALEFYRRSCGAEPAHRFVAFARQQP